MSPPLLLKGYMKEVKELKKQNQQLQMRLASKEFINATLDCTKQNNQEKEYKTNKEQQVKVIWNLKDGTLKKRNENDNNHAINLNNKKVIKDNLKCQHCSTKFSDLIVMKKHKEMCRTYFQL